MKILSRISALLLAFSGLVFTPTLRADDGGLFRSSLAGQLLVATTQIGDPRFARTVIYMISHGREGAMGLVVNRAYGTGSFGTLLESLGVPAGSASGNVRLQYGGPVEPQRGFVLHTGEYAGPTTRRIADRIAVSFGTDVLQAMAEGDGPERSLVILGYAGWGPGQLEREIAREDWLTAPAEERLIFSDDLDKIWDRAMANAGLTL